MVIMNSCSKFHVELSQWYTLTDYLNTDCAQYKSSLALESFAFISRLLATILFSYSLSLSLGKCFIPFPFLNHPRSAPLARSLSLSPSFPVIFQIPFFCLKLNECDSSMSTINSIKIARDCYYYCCSLFSISFLLILLQHYNCHIPARTKPSSFDEQINFFNLFFFDWQLVRILHFV